jgi:L-lactate dehydrogenase complex protein LldG
MTASREQILNKLRAARRPFPDAPPRPQPYRPLADLTGASPEALLERFSEIVTALKGNVFVVKGDKGATEKVLELLQSHSADQVLAWDFKHIPVRGLKTALKEAGITAIHPDLYDELRAETIEAIRGVLVGLTGADAALAATGTLVVSTAPGKGRIPTVLAPVHIAVIKLDQLLPNLEAWVGERRANGLDLMSDSGNICFISGPSRTGDIENILILGVHGPNKIQIIVKT